MIIKMVNEFKLTVVHFARPNPMQICACPWIYRWTKKTVENQDWATGPPGRRGPWAAGLLLGKPREQQTHFRSSGGRGVTTGNASAVLRLQY